MDEEKWWQKRWGFSAGMLILCGYLGFQGWRTIAKLDDTSVEYLANSTTILVNVGLLYGVVFGGRQFVEWLVQTLVKVLRDARILVPVPRASSRAAPAAQTAAAGVTAAAVVVKPQAVPTPVATAPSEAAPASEPPPPPSSSSASRKRSVWPATLVVGTLSMIALIAVVFWPRSRPVVPPPVRPTPEIGDAPAPPSTAPQAMPSYCTTEGDAFTCRLEAGKALWDIESDCYGDPMRANEMWEANQARLPGRTVREIPQGTEISMIGACIVPVQ